MTSLHDIIPWLQGLWLTVWDLDTWKHGTGWMGCQIVYFVWLIHLCFETRTKTTVSLCRLFRETVNGIFPFCCCWISQHNSAEMNLWTTQSLCCGGCNMEPVKNPNKSPQNAWRGCLPHMGHHSKLFWTSFSARPAQQQTVQTIAFRVLVLPFPLW